MDLYVTIDVLQYWAQMIEAFMYEFKESSDRLLSEIPEDQQLVELTVDMNMVYHEAIAYLSMRIKQQERGAIEATAAAIAAMPPPSTPSLPPQPKINTKLLGVFDRRPMNWSLFKEKYTTMVHNLEMDPLIKFQYLVNAVSGRAEALVGPFSTTDRKFEEAWNRLCEFYESARMQVKTLIDQLLTWPKIRPASLADINRLHVWLKEFVDRCQNRNCNPTQWSEVIIHLVEQIMDENTWKSWGVQLQHPDINSLIEFLDRRARRLKIRTESPTWTGLGRPYSRTLEMKKPCPKCGYDHPLYKCKEYVTKTVSEREKQVKMLGVCPNCLKTGHTRDACILGPCRNCTGLKRHHSTLCTKLEKRLSDKQATGTVTKINSFVQKNVTSTVTSTVTSISVQSAQQQQLLPAQNIQDNDRNDESHNPDVEMTSVTSDGGEIVTLNTNQQEKMEITGPKSETPVGESTINSIIMPHTYAHLFYTKQFDKKEITLQNLEPKHLTEVILQACLPHNIQHWQNDIQRAIDEAALKRSPTGLEEDTPMRSDDEIIIQDQQAIDQVDTMIPTKSSSEVKTNEVANDKTKKPRTSRNESKETRKHKRSASKKP